MEILLLLAIIAFGVYYFATNKERTERKRKEQQAARRAAENARPDVSSRLRVIFESINILRSSKNLSTATSRYTIAVDLLQELLGEYPHRSDWRELLETVQEDGREYLHSMLGSELDKLIDRSTLARTASGKINPLVKALQTLNEAATSGNYDPEWVNTRRFAIELLIHATELGKLIETATRFEFKEEWKKAGSAYQDVLYFLTHDSIPDEEQESLITLVEQKVADMKNR